MTQIGAREAWGGLVTESSSEPPISFLTSLRLQIHMQPCMALHMDAIDLNPSPQVPMFSWLTIFLHQALSSSPNEKVSNQETILLREQCFFTNQYLFYKMIWLNGVKATRSASVVTGEKHSHKLKAQPTGSGWWVACG